MSRYKYGKTGNSTSDKTEKSKTAFKVTFLTVLLLIPAVVYIIISTLPPNPVTGKSIDKGTFDPTVTFTTDWFSFIAPNRWEEAADQHVKDKQYVYRERNGADLQGLLTIYVNNSPVPYQDYYTNILPAVVKDGNRLEIQELQDDCSKVVPGSQKKGNPVALVQSEVSFTCWVDNPNFYAAIGEVGGGTGIRMRRTSGEIAIYRIVYQNTAFSPSKKSFEDALGTFTAK